MCVIVNVCKYSGSYVLYFAFVLLGLLDCQWTGECQIRAEISATILTNGPRYTLLFSHNTIQTVN